MHSNVALGSLVNAKDAFAPVVALVIVVSGAAVSTVQVRVAGVGSRFVAVSRARTENVYVPSVRPV